MAGEVKHTPTPWLREGTTIYALNEQHENRMILHIQGGYIWRSHDRAAPPESREHTTSEELEATAIFILKTANAHDELIAALDIHQSWLRAALDCKTWDWDSDQRAAAEHSYASGLAILAKLSA